MAIVFFSIRGGQAPFTAQLTPSSQPPRVYNTTGDYGISGVADGIYTLIITDANNCVYEKEIIVDPAVTTTTTTIVEDDAIVVGNAQDPLLIFNESATNRSSEYSGYPDPNIVTLFLWMKTLDGKPLTVQKAITYNIYSYLITNGANFEIVDYSDQIHSEVVKNVVGPALSITGDIILKPGFIESYYQYTYYKYALSNPNNEYVIDLGATSPMFDTNLELTGGTKTKGVTTAESDRVVMQF